MRAVVAEVHTKEVQVMVELAVVAVVEVLLEEAQVVLLVLVGVLH